jgi:hypothetical protein
MLIFINDQKANMKWLKLVEFYGIENLELGGNNRKCLNICKLKHIYIYILLDNFFSFISLFVC